MTYQETINYLFTHLPMYQRIGPAAFKKDLTNTFALLKILDDPHKKFTSIHVAGTNGKGSVSNMLASVLQEAGYSTGLYTSPHLLDFRERIRLNGIMCEKEFVIDFVERIKPHIQQIEPSFFEITVAMAFDYFAQKEIDIAVIEVGLGGRLDSTNVITPILSVITNISYDHQVMLGNTLKEIAGEKAGIIKQNIPVVIGEFSEETFPVFLEKANSLDATLFLADDNVEVENLSEELNALELNISYLDQLIFPNLMLDLTGSYQLKNIKTTVQSIEVLRNIGVEIPDEAIYEGLKQVKKNTGFAGRWQIISEHPLIICDCAHNSTGLAELFDQVGKTPHHNLHIVTGAVNDKDLQANLLKFTKEAIYYFCKPDIPRGLETAVLEQLAKTAGLQGKSFLNVTEAVQAAREEMMQDDLLLICGSIFVVAEALEFFDHLKITLSNKEKRK